MDPASKIQQEPQTVEEWRERFNALVGKIGMMEERMSTVVYKLKQESLERKREAETWKEKFQSLQEVHTQMVMQAKNVGVDPMALESGTLQRRDTATQFEAAVKHHETMIGGYHDPTNLPAKTSDAYNYISEGSFLQLSHEETVRAMENGRIFHVYSEAGRALMLVQYRRPPQDKKDDAGALVWRQPQSTAVIGSLPLDEVSAVLIGKQTFVFRKSEVGGRADGDRCASVVGEEGRALNVEAHTSTQLASWLFGLQTLLYAIGKRATLDRDNNNNNSNNSSSDPQRRYTVTSRRLGEKEEYHLPSGLPPSASTLMSKMMTRRESVMSVSPNETIRMMTNGQVLTRYLADRTEKVLLFYAPHDGPAGALYWCPPNQRQEIPSNRMQLHKVTDINIGKSRVFPPPLTHPLAVDRPESLFFSLVTAPPGPVLLLEANSEEQVTAWLFGISTALAGVKPLADSTPRATSPHSSSSFPFPPITSPTSVATLPPQMATSNLPGTPKGSKKPRKLSAKTHRPPSKPTTDPTQQQHDVGVVVDTNSSEIQAMMEGAFFTGYGSTAHPKRERVYAYYLPTEGKYGSIYWDAVPEDVVGVSLLSTTESSSFSHDAANAEVRALLQTLKNKPRNNSQPERWLPLHKLAELFLGKQHPFFQIQPITNAAVEEHCISLMTSDSDLHLEADSPSTARTWLTGISTVLTTAAKREVRLVNLNAQPTDQDQSFKRRNFSVVEKETHQHQQQPQQQQHAHNAPLEQGAVFWLYEPLNTHMIPATPLGTIPGPSATPSIRRKVILTYNRNEGKLGTLHATPTPPTATVSTPAQVDRSSNVVLPLHALTDIFVGHELGIFRNAEIGHGEKPPVQDNCIAMVGAPPHSSMYLEAMDSEQVGTWTTLITDILTAQGQVVLPTDSNSSSSNNNTSNMMNQGGGGLGSPIISLGVPVVLSSPKPISSASPPGHDAQALVEVLTTGAPFTRYITNGTKKEEIFVFFDGEDGSRSGSLYWCPMPAPSRKGVNAQTLPLRVKSLERSFPLSAVTDLYVGKKHPIFKSSPASKAVEARCVSLQSVSRSIDLHLEARSEDALKPWLTALHFLLTAPKPAAQHTGGMKPELQLQALATDSAGRFEQRAYSVRSPPPPNDNNNNNNNSILLQESVEDQYSAAIVRGGVLWRYEEVSGGNGNGGSGVVKTEIYLQYVPPHAISNPTDSKLGQLRWHTHPAAEGGGAVAELHQFTDFYVGRNHPFWNTGGEVLGSAREECCLSLVGPHHQLHLEADSEDAQNLWLTALSQVFQQHGQPTLPEEIAPAMTSEGLPFEQRKFSVLIGRAGQDNAKSKAQILAEMMDGRVFESYRVSPPPNSPGRTIQQEAAKENIFLFLHDEDGTPSGSLYWCPADQYDKRKRGEMVANPGNRCLPLDELTDLCLGKQEAVWHTTIAFGVESKEALSLLGDHSQLHLRGPSDVLRDWLSGIHYQLASSGTKIELDDNREITNAAGERFQERSYSVSNRGVLGTQPPVGSPLNKAQEITELLSLARDGDMFIVHTQSGQSEMLVFYDPQDGTELGSIYWCVPGSGTRVRGQSLSLAELTDVFLGRNHPFFSATNKGPSAADSQFLSLQANTQQLHLQAHTEQQRNRWMALVKHVLDSTASKDLELVDRKHITQQQQGNQPPRSSAAFPAPPSRFEQRAYSVKSRPPLTSAIFPTTSAASALAASASSSTAKKQQGGKPVQLSPEAELVQLGEKALVSMAAGTEFFSHSVRGPTTNSYSGQTQGEALSRRVVVAYRESGGRFGSVVCDGKSYPLHALTDIYGGATAPFWKHPSLKSVRQECCMSLIFLDHHDLHLEAANASIVKEWFNGLRHVLSRAGQEIIADEMSKGKTETGEVFEQRRLSVALNNRQTRHQKAQGGAGGGGGGEKGNLPISSDKPREQLVQELKRGHTFTAFFFSSSSSFAPSDQGRAEVIYVILEPPSTSSSSSSSSSSKGDLYWFPSAQYNENYREQLIATWTEGGRMSLDALTDIFVGKQHGVFKDPTHQSLTARAREECTLSLIANPATQKSQQGGPPVSSELHLEASSATQLKDFLLGLDHYLSNVGQGMKLESTTEVPSSSGDRYEQRSFSIAKQ